MSLGEGGTPRWGHIDIGREYTDVRNAVTGFCDREERDFHPAEIGEQLIHLSQTIDMLRREHARLAGVFSQSREWDRQAFNSDVDWVRHNCRLSVSDSLQAVAVGQHLGQLPGSSGALDRGEIGFGHLVHIARNAAFSARSRTASFDEAPLVTRAVDESVSRFRHTCLNLRHVQDPEGVVRDEVTAVEMREVTFNPQDDGTTYINLRVDAPTAAIVERDTRHRARRLGPDDLRSRTRREADAMVDRLVGEGGPAVDITVSCTPDSLLGLTGAPAAEVDYADPVSGEMVQRLACNASFTKILLDDRLVPVAAATARRVPSRRERKAMDLAQQRCQGRGCHRSASQCSPHHVVWYSRSRRTKIGEMLLLCPHHHWMVHEGGWDVAIRSDGSALWIPPLAGLSAVGARSRAGPQTSAA